MFLMRAPSFARCKRRNFCGHWQGRLTRCYAKLMKHATSHRESIVGCASWRLRTHTVRGLALIQFSVPGRMAGIMGGMPFFGYHMPSFTFAGVPPDRLFDHVGGLARSAESAGFELVTVMDHFYQITGVGAEEEPMLEGYATLAALARETSRVRLATLVTGVTYRNPALVAKMVKTIDVMSKGRAICGIGAAWNESEHSGYGFAFPPIRERMDRLDEALTILKLMFTQERPSFAGTHYRIDRALNNPRPLQPGGPPT